jgi:hypothetical protein
VAPVATSTETGPSGLLAVAALLTGGSATPVPAAAVNVTPCSRGTRTSPTSRGCWHPAPSRWSSRGGRGWWPRGRGAARHRLRGAGARGRGQRDTVLMGYPDVADSARLLASNPVMAELTGQSSIAAPGATQRLVAAGITRSQGVRWSRRWRLCFFSGMFQSLYIIRREELCTKCATTTQTSLGGWARLTDYTNYYSAM